VGSRAADKFFGPVLPEKRKRDDPPPTIDQFRPSSASFGVKRLKVDGEDLEDGGLIVREVADKQEDLVSQFASSFPTDFRLQPLPAAPFSYDSVVQHNWFAYDSVVQPLPAAPFAYDSVVQHNWFPELLDFLTCFVNTMYDFLNIELRTNVCLLFVFVLVLCICLSVLFFLMCVLILSACLFSCPADTSGSRVLAYASFRR
jgi:hypothetical protein